MAEDFAFNYVTVNYVYYPIVFSTKNKIKMHELYTFAIGNPRTKITLFASKS